MVPWHQKWNLWWSRDGRKHTGWNVAWGNGGDLHSHVVLSSAEAQQVKYGAEFVFERCRLAKRTPGGFWFGVRLGREHGRREAKMCPINRPPISVFSRSVDVNAYRYYRRGSPHMTKFNANFQPITWSSFQRSWVKAEYKQNREIFKSYSTHVQLNSVQRQDVSCSNR